VLAASYLFLINAFLEAVPQALGHRAIAFFLQDKIKMDKAHGDEIGMEAAKTCRMVGGAQISAALVAGKGRILRLNFLVPPL